MTYKEAKREFEIQYWSALMKHHRQNVTHTATAAGMSRTSCYRKLVKAGVNTPGRKDGNWGGL
jgi:DNA-binding NtrC family response regulator